MLWGFSLLVLLSLPAIDLAYLFDMFYHKFCEENRKKKSNSMELQLNHFVQSTEAEKGADLRMTTLMQNWQLHSRSYISICLMGLRMVT
jgi:hypothetical protein